MSAVGPSEGLVFVEDHVCLVAGLWEVHVDPNSSAGDCVGSRHVLSVSVGACFAVFGSYVSLNYSSDMLRLKVWCVSGGSLVVSI